MSRTNLIQVRRGHPVPPDNVLEEYELGYVTSDQHLYIGRKNSNGTAVTAKEISDVYIGSTQPATDTGYKIWVDLNNTSASVLPISNGGTGSSNGSIGLKNLFASGKTVISSYQYGTNLPTAGTPGAIFFKKV